MFVHVVYFWFKEGTPDSARQRLIDDCQSLLTRIPTVRHLWAGKNVRTPREVVDKTYDVGLCVVLDDAKGHDVYQQHALHLEFIANNKAHWKQIRVCDFE